MLRFQFDFYGFRGIIEKKNNHNKEDSYAYTYRT